jgi:hypothetical protein
MQQAEILQRTTGLGLQKVCSAQERIRSKLTHVEGIDFRQGNLDYSGCTLFMGGLSQNLIRRAQSDSGNCSETLDNACVTALQNELESIAMGYVATNTDNSPAPGNLSAGSLPRVCSDIATDFTNDNAVPDACAQFVGPKKTRYDGVDSNITFVYVRELTACLLYYHYQTESVQSYHWSKFHNRSDLRI